MNVKSNKGENLMALKTMSASSDGGKFSAGWHTVTICKAEYGTYEGTDGDKRYLDLWFTDYPDNLNLRAYETVNSKTGEEFKVSNIFKFANAGIAGVLKDPNGKEVIQYDDDESGLINAVVNVYFYKEQKTGKEYSRIYENIAPVAQEGEHLSFTETQVNGIKSGVEASCKKMLDKVVANGAAEAPVEMSIEDVAKDLPF